MTGVLPLIIETVPQHARKAFCRAVRMVRKVTMVLAGQENMQRVMKVVIPLGVVSAAQQISVIVVVLQNEMHMPAGRNVRAYLAREFWRPIVRRHRVNRIQPQSVEA